MSRVCSRRHVFGLAAAAAGALAMPHIARAAVRTLRLGHGNPDDGSFGAGSRALAAAVAADPVLSGVIQIDVYGKGTLGDELTLLKNCIAGTIDLALCSNVVTGNLVKEVDLLYAPYLFANARAARAVLDGPIGAELSTALKAQGLNLLAWGENGMRHVGAGHPVRALADLQGSKIRVPQSAMMLAGLKALGADPAPLPFNLLREAFRTGQFQALENTTSSFKASKLYEFANHLSLTGHCYDSTVFVASNDVMEDLTPAQTQALLACAAKGAEVTRHETAVADDLGIKSLAGLGVTVVSDVDIPALRAAAQPFLNSVAQREKAAFAKKLIAAAS